MSAGAPTDDYELIEEIARGGMGVVYRARQRSLDRIVAIKTILAGDAEGCRRMRLEAAAAARLRHPNIVPVYEVGENNGQPWFSMELVDGPSLAKILDDGPLPARKAAQYVRDVALAIDYAHGQDTIHRDLKPSNILVDVDDRPRVTDFGVARTVEGGTDLTVTGQVLGTPGYLPPEQALGRADEVGPVSDVYSLGAVLFELLTGRPPFRADNPLVTLRMTLETDPVAPCALNTSVPKDLETVCLRCLEKVAARRYASAAELAAELDRWLAGEPILARPVGMVERLQKWVRRRPTAAALVAVSVLSTVAIVVALSWAFLLERDLRGRAGSAEEEGRRRLVLLLSGRAADALERDDSGAALLWSAEALSAVAGDADAEAVLRTRIAVALDDLPELRDLVAFADSGPATRTGTLLAVVDTQQTRILETFTGRVLASDLPPARRDMVVFSHDGERLLIARETGQTSELSLWHTTSGQLVAPVVTFPVGIQHVRFGPDDERIFVALDDTSVHVCNHDGQPLGTSLDAKAWIAELDVSRDGRRVLATSGFGDERHFEMWDVNSGAPVMPRASVRFQPRYVAFLSPDGRWFCADKVLWDVGAGTPAKLPEWHRDAVRDSCISAAGDMVATACRDGTARVWDSNSLTPITPELRHPAAVDQVVFSLDGGLIATSAGDDMVRLWSTRTGEQLCPPLRHGSDVRFVGFADDDHLVTSSGPRLGGVVWRRWNLSEHRRRAPRRVPGVNQSAAFSRDGLRVAAYVSDRVTIHDGATGATELTIEPEFPVDRVVFGPAARRLMLVGGYSAGAPMAAQLWDLGNGAPVAEPIVYDDRFRADVSADLTRLLARQDGSLWVLDAATGEQLVGPIGGSESFQRAWFGPDDRHAVTATDSGVLRVWHVDTSVPASPEMQHGERVDEVALAPGGRWMFSVGITKHDLKFWDVASGRPLAPSIAGASSPAFAPDGLRIATAGGPGLRGARDRESRVWQAHTGLPITPPLRHNGVVFDVTFSPDGLAVLSNSMGKARFWDAKTGLPITRWLTQDHWFARAQLDEQGAHIRALAHDMTVRRWRLARDQRPAERMQQEARLLTGHRIDATGAVAPLSDQELVELYRRLR